MAMKTLEIGPGDEVVIPTYVCGSLLSAVRFVGAIPVLCDSGRFWNAEAECIAAVATKRTKAVILPYLYGIPMPQISAIVALGFPVIEDIAQAFGTVNPDGRNAGTCGRMCVCSFHATKCLTTGEGGMVLSDHSHDLEALRALSAMFPMSDLQASLGVSQLSEYQAFVSRRREIATSYITALAAIEDHCVPAHLRSGNIFFRFVLKVSQDFSAVASRFADLGITVRRGVDRLIHRSLGLDDGEFPVATNLYDQTLSLPIYPALRDDEVQRIARAALAIVGA